MVRAFRRLAPPPRPEVDPGADPLAPPPPPPAPILRPDWTPDSLAPHVEDVEVYSNAPEVELRLGKRVIGKMAKPADDSPRIFKVPFEPGTLTAVALDKGKSVATHEMTTAGPAARLVVKSDRTIVTPTFDDVAHITVEVVDAKGVVVPAASDEITFTVEGPAAIVAVDNGDPQSHESYQGTKRHAFLSRALALVRATAAAGKITITASAPGLASGSATFEAGSQSR